MKTIKDIDVKNKTVLVRVDYNVPVKNGKVENDLRIRASLPTINYLLEHGAKRIILISHLGRPDGKISPDFILYPIVKVLKKLLPNQTIGFYDLPRKDEHILIPEYVKVAILENLRFDPREEKNDPEFITNIAKSVDADIYVQDGFAVVHRAHASTDAIKNYLPIYAGLLVENEVKNLTAITKKPESPVLLIIGGAKVDDKQPLIDKFLKQADHIFVGGKIAADGYKSTHKKIVVANDFDINKKGEKLDIGPVSTGELANLITDAKTIIWNGLLGYAEDPTYANVAQLIKQLNAN